MPNRIGNSLPKHERKVDTQRRVCHSIGRIHTKRRLAIPMLGCLGKDRLQICIESNFPLALVSRRSSAHNLSNSTLLPQPGAGARPPVALGYLHFHYLI